MARSAADLLARLPGSGYSRRMVDRAQKLVQLQRRFLGGWSATVEVPQTLDDSLKADRVEDKSPHRALGSRAWILAQIIGSVPLSCWETGASPAAVISAFEQTEWSEPLILGLNLALHRHKSSAWFEALTRRWLNQKERSLSLLENIPPFDSYPVVSEQLIMELLRSNKQPLSDDHRAFLPLNTLRSAWSLPLSLAVLVSIAGRSTDLRSQDIRVYQLQSALPRFALYMSPAVAEHVSSAFPIEKSEFAPGWSNAIEKMVAKVQFRHDMLAAIDDDKRETE